MPQRQPPTPGLFLSIFVGASLAAAWISVRPSDFLGAACIAIGCAACLFIVLRLYGYTAVADDGRRLPPEDRTGGPEPQTPGQSPA